MKKISTLSLLVLGLGASVSAHASQSGGSMTLAGLKAKCAELSANEQLKPFKAVVTCKQVVTEWRPSQQPAEPLKIENVKEIGATFSLKGYTVPFQSERVAANPSEAPCVALEQFKLSVPAVDLELACDALNNVQSVTELCGPAIDERLAADPGIQIVESTGAIFNSCKGR